MQSIDWKATAMRSDLQALEITQGEFRHLVGASMHDVTVPFMHRVFELSCLFLVLSLGIVMRLWSYLIQNNDLVESVRQHTYGLMGIYPTYELAQALMLVAAGGVAIALAVIPAIAKRWFWLRDRHITMVLLRLIRETETYNAVLRAIDIGDQLEEAGNPDVALRDRTTILDALQLTRMDLIRALKTERILRENQPFISRHSDLFADNLATLTAISVIDQASEQGRILNQTLQVAVEVQQELRKLRNS
jgi:hypothetical protein